MVQSEAEHGGARDEFVERNITPELRPVDPSILHDFLTDHWEQIRVEAAPSGKKI